MDDTGSALCGHGGIEEGNVQHGWEPGRFPPLVNADPRDFGISNQDGAGLFLPKDFLAEYPPRDASLQRLGDNEQRVFHPGLPPVLDADPHDDQPETLLAQLSIGSPGRPEKGDARAFQVVEVDRVVHVAIGIALVALDSQAVLVAHWSNPTGGDRHGQSEIYSTHAGREHGMISVRKSHAILWLAGIGLLVFFLLSSSPDLGLIPVVLAAAGHFITNIIFSLRTRVKRQFRIDHAWSAAHQESSAEALLEVFEEEKSGGEFALPVRLEAHVASGTALHAPWSQSSCVGWGIEVDLYKSSILGGDADYTPLEQSSRFDPFRLGSGGQEVQVLPPGIVRGAGAKEELFGWSLLDEHPELRKIVDNAMQLQKFERTKYSGVRVRESSFGKGDVVTVWGTAAKGKSDIEVKGSGTTGAADALLVSPPGGRAPSRHRVRFAVRTAVNTVLAAGCLLLAAAFVENASWWHLEQQYAWLNVDRVGLLHWNGDGSSADVACRTLNLSGPSNWSLDPEDESVNLVSGSEKALVDARTRITVSRARLASFRVSPGSFMYPLFAVRAFLFTVPRGAASVPEVSVHEGALVVDNRTAAAVEIRFLTASARKELADVHWTISPGERTRLILKDSSFSLTEGDGVLLRRTGESAKRDLFVTLGGNPAVAWIQKDSQWVLTVDAGPCPHGRAALHVRNPNDFDVRMKVFEAGSDTPQETWTLPAGFGGADGTVLESGGAPFVFNEGDSVLIEPLAVDTLYDGPLGSCPTAAWKDGLWTLRPPRAR